MRAPGSQREAEAEAGLEPSFPHNQFKPSPLLHLACLPKSAPSDWEQEPSSESRVTQPNEGQGDLTPMPSQTEVPIPWLLSPPSTSLAGGTIRWKSKMPNLSVYALNSCLAKFILGPVGRGQQVETPEMICGCVCVCACVCMCVHVRLVVHCMGGSHQIP